MTVVRTTSRVLQARPVPWPLRRAARTLRDRVADLQQGVFERWLGVSTRGLLYLEDVGEEAEGRAFYAGCDYLPVRHALRALDPGPQDVFADLGSGKGQAVLIAGMLPFRRVIGVDVVEQLTRDAQGNIAKARGRLRAERVEAITADVLEWEIPGDLSVVFMFCPFTGELFHRAMGRLFASYDEHPRPLRILYAFPWEHNWLMRSGRVVLEDLRPAQWPAWPWWWRTSWVMPIYRVVGPGEGGSRVPDLPRRPLRPRRALERWSAPNDNVFRLVRDGEAVESSDEH